MAREPMLEVEPARVRADRRAWPRPRGTPAGIGHVSYAPKPGPVALPLVFLAVPTGLLGLAALGPTLAGRA